MKLNKTVLPNLITFTIIVAVSVYILIQSGAMTDVLAGKFDNASTRVANYVSGFFELSGGGGTNMKGKKLANVRILNSVQLIVPDVCYTFDDINGFKDLFRSDKKVVFYVYSPQEKDTANEIKSYINKYYAKTYVDMSMNKERFIDKKSDVQTQNNGCSTLEECRKMQANSSRHTQISSFVENCAKGVCIINNKTRHYAKISSKDPDKVKELLKKYAQE